MPTDSTSDVPEALLAVLGRIDPRQRPRPFDIAEALDDALDSVPLDRQPELAVEVAQRILALCSTCDVAYTANVLDLVDRVVASAPDGPPRLLVRAHLVAARAYVFDQSGDKSSSLASALRAIADAASLEAPVIEPSLWAAALLDLARAAELSAESGHGIDYERIYATISATADDDSACYRSIAARRALLSSSSESPRPSVRVRGERSIDSLQRLLERYDSDILPVTLAPVATRLGRLYLSRGLAGDGDRSRHWLQAAERSFYYNGPAEIEEYARNQIELARYFALVTVADPDDADYVADKALLHLELGFQSAGDDVDIQGECFAVAALVWAHRDRDHAIALLSEALDLKGLSTAARGRLELHYARALGRSPAALAATDRAVASLRSDPEAEEDLLAAMVLHAKLLVAVNAGEDAPPAEAERRIQRATSVIRDAAAGLVKRGDLSGAYHAYRTSARWGMDRKRYAEALIDYEQCRIVAELMARRDLFRFAEGSGGSIPEGAERDALLYRPTSALATSHRAMEIAVNLASIDHQAAAYCAAHVGRLDEALQWIVGSRLRTLGFRRSSRPADDLLPAPSAERIIAVPIPGNDDTVVLIFRHGREVEALTVPLTYAELRRMVYEDDGADGYDLGWVRLYGEFEHDAPFASTDLSEHVNEPNELWWHSLKDALARYARRFAQPLLEQLNERPSAATTLLFLPGGLQSFMPLHAVELEDDSWVADHYAIQVGFTPSLPAPAPRSDAGDGRALVARGDNELFFTRLETRIVSTCFEASGVPVLPEPRGREEFLASIGRAQYLHIASHGLFDTSRWLDSRIELSSDETITLRDIYTRDLSHVRLATLSACETGITHIAGLREEFHGFPAAFISAGAHAVLCTLWRVDDLSSALLLEQFYDEYRHGAHPATALNDARWRLRSLTAGALVERARARLTAGRSDGSWSPSQASAVIGRFQDWLPESRPFESPYHWAAYALWNTD